MALKDNYNQTSNVSYLGYVVQAVVNNFAPFLSLTFQKSYGMSLAYTATLVMVNLGTQLAVDLLSVRFVNRIGCKTRIVAAHAFVALGLVGLGFLPDMIPGHFEGLFVYIALYIVGRGIIEVPISPVMEACPTTRKDAAMSLLYPPYCRRSVAMAVSSTVFFQTAGLNSWRVLALLWATVPVMSAVLFSRVPILALTEDG